MAAATGTVTFSPSPPSFLTSHLRRGHHQPASASITTIAFFARRSNRSRGKAAPVAHPDPDDGFGALEAELWRLRRLAELRIHRLATEADAAYRDLRSAVREASGDRVVLTFRRSSLHFLAGALLSLLACAVAARVLLGMILRAWRRRGLWGTGEGGRAAVVRRRDRSLGGKEVVVALPSTSSPMAAAARTSRVVPEPAKEEVWRRYSQAKKLPDWWPPKVGATATVMETSPSPEMEKSARMANRLVRAMIDNRVMGKDYRYSDAIQLRQLCKISGVKVSFDTENARDSFYRAAVNFVLDDCSRAAAKDIVAAKINGEDPRDFLAGLASNIGLDEFRAATLVRASIATRTRTCFLQCWALEIQGKRAEALDELVKICRIYEVFPPEDNSAEMEMVAAGLEKNLSVDERLHLLYLYRSVRTDGNLKTAAEALGLSLPDEMRIQQQKD